MKESSWKCGKNVLEVNVDGHSNLTGESVRFIHDCVVVGLPCVLFLVYCVVGMCRLCAVRSGCNS